MGPGIEGETVFLCGGCGGLKGNLNCGPDRINIGVIVL
jgi:hypothetical protein